MLVLAGCRGIPTSGENQARRGFGVVASHTAQETLSGVFAGADGGFGLEQSLAYALFNSPTWRPFTMTGRRPWKTSRWMRSLPDRRSTFQSDIRRQTALPGFMQEFPGPGKLQMRAGAAAAGKPGPILRL